MAGKKPVSPVSPIKDPNCDGILQGGELIAQLISEEENGFRRTKNESVHGVLEALGMRGFSEEYAKQMLVAQLAGQPEKREEFLGQLSVKGAQLIQKMIETGARVSADPEFEKNFKNRNKDIKNSSQLSEGNKEIMNSDFENLIEFGKAYKSTFPGGVEISPKDTLGIVAHFTPIPIRIPENIQKKDKGI